MELAAGLVVFGATKIWQRLDLNGFILCGLGGLIAIETRSYAGWFLVSAAVLLTLHAALRRLDRPLRAMPIVYAVVLIVFLATPTLLSVTSNASLQRLQQAQGIHHKNGAQATGNTGGPNSDNLALEQVDFFYPWGGHQKPARADFGVFDLLFRPYPWQLQDTSQQLGAVGSIVALAVLLLPWSAYGWRSRGHILAVDRPDPVPAPVPDGRLRAQRRQRRDRLPLPHAPRRTRCGDARRATRARASRCEKSQAPVIGRGPRTTPRSTRRSFTPDACPKLLSRTYDPMSVAPDSTGQQDLSTYLRIFWRWKFLLLAFVVLIPLAVYLIERSKPKVYESSTLIELQDVSAAVVGCDRRADRDAATSTPWLGW